MLDRIDLQVHVQSLEYDAITEQTQQKASSENMYKKVQVALHAQKIRFNHDNQYNSTMQPDVLEKQCILTPAAQVVIKKAFDKLNLSMRGYHKIIKVARTIADIESSDQVDAAHLQEAIMYRSLDQYLERQRSNH